MTQENIEFEGRKYYWMRMEDKIWSNKKGEREKKSKVWRKKNELIERTVKFIDIEKES